MKLLTIKLRKQKHRAAGNGHKVEYQEIGGVKYLLLSRDWANVSGSDAPKTTNCPFCGSKHTHKGANGYRMAHCLDADTLTCIADDGTLLRAKDGYIVVDINK